MNDWEFTTDQEWDDVARVAVESASSARAEYGGGQVAMTAYDKEGRVLRSAIALVAGDLEIGIDIDLQEISEFKIIAAYRERADKDE